jgi:hypothetical protein
MWFNCTDSDMIKITYVQMQKLCNMHMHNAHACICTICQKFVAKYANKV